MPPRLNQTLAASVPLEAPSTPQVPLLFLSEVREPITRQTMASKNYREIAANAQKRRNDALSSYLLSKGVLKGPLPRNVTLVPTDAGHYSHEETEIIHSQAEDILLKIRERIWTSLEVTLAFCKAATAAHQLV